MSKLALNYSASSTCANLTWAFIGEAKQSYTFRTKVLGGSKAELQIEHYPQNQTDAFIDLEPGFLYKITVEAVCKNKVIAAADVCFKSLLTNIEIAALHVRAINFICKEIFGSDMEEISIFYRSKPPAYWQNIQIADRVMKPYIKDFTGHPGSPINGEINGLFFSGRLIKGALPIASPYGSQRFKIPCQKLFLPERHNLYFADFYCNQTRHYVTLVICEVDTDVDKYCSDKLFLLNPFNNMFLQVSEHNSYDYKYFLNNNIWIEILYTADVRLWWGEFDYIFPLGESDPNGIPNNKTCKICNMFPVGGDVKSV